MNRKKTVVGIWAVGVTGFLIEFMSLLIGFLRSLREDTSLNYHLSHHQYWTLINTPDFKDFLIAVVVRLILGGAITAVVFFLVLPRNLHSIKEIIRLIPSAVKREHLMAGAFAAVGGVVLATIFYFLAIIDTAAPYLSIVVASVIIGTAGAGLLTTIIYAIDGGEGKSGSGWAVLGGFLGSAGGFIISLSIYLSLR